MTDFTVRIEMHGATSEDYELLHARMQEKGFERYVSGRSTTDGSLGTWILPTGEYNFSSTLEAKSVRDLAKEVADGIRSGSWCLVTAASARSWSTRKIS